MLCNMDVQEILCSEWIAKKLKSMTGAIKTYPMRWANPLALDLEFTFL